MKASHLSIALVAGLIFIAGIFGLSLYITYGGPDGRTIESREELIAKYREPRNEKWTIMEEREAEGYIISGLRNEEGNYVIAVFEPAKGERYKIQSWWYGEDDDVVYNKFRMNNVWYDAAWYNGDEKMEYAEIKYTIDGKDQIVKKFDITDSPIIYTETPDASSYSFDIAYYDSAGNEYRT